MRERGHSARDPHPKIEFIENGLSAGTWRLEVALRATPLGETTAQQTLQLLQELLKDYHPRNFAIQLWDGTQWDGEPGQFCRFTWKINSPAALRAALEAGDELALAEAYIAGDFDIEGNVEAVYPLGLYLVKRRWSLKEKLHLRGLLQALPSEKKARPERPGAKVSGRVHSKERDQKVVSYHYDVSNDFYALWLDRAMVYSCAYFKSPDDDIDTAQAQKLDYICRKLRLRRGERLLDIGCGWGGLILHAVQHYGVRALGITLSQHQFDLANQRIREASLSDHCAVKLCDYREVDEPGAYDKLVSVGMVEHVGKGMLPEYFRQAFRLLRPGGVFLNHGIGQAGNHPAPDKPTFTSLYVFPDGELVPIGTMLQTAEEAGFEVHDVENLREHYVLTLRQWVRRLEAHAERARQIAGEIKYRIWRLYMAGSAYQFRKGWLDLYQSLLVKTQEGPSGLPLRRADWYDG